VENNEPAFVDQLKMIKPTKDLTTYDELKVEIKIFLKESFKRFINFE
jgi:hypothetical protein